jgi:hypothetical protein
MNNLKFIVVYDRHKLRTSKRVRGIVGKLYSFLDSREWHSADNKNLIQKIFQYVHIRASHHNDASRERWKAAERRMINRYKNSI